MSGRDETDRGTESFDAYESTRRDWDRYVQTQKRKKTLNRFWSLMVVLLWIPFFWFLFFWELRHLIKVSAVLQAVAVFLSFLPFIVAWVIDRFFPSLREAVENSVAGFPHESDR